MQNKLIQVAKLSVVAAAVALGACGGGGGGSSVADGPAVKAFKQGMYLPDIDGKGIIYRGADANNQILLKAYGLDAALPPGKR